MIISNWILVLVVILSGDDDILSIYGICIAPLQGNYSETLKPRPGQKGRS